MQVRCPACLSAVEFGDTVDLSNLSCPTCGSRFDLLGDPTTTYLHREGKMLGHFELLRPLGSGAYGEVWLAWDTELDRQVAIKIPRLSTSDPREQEAMLREAQAAARLDHPNVVRVHEVGRDGGTCYIVSEYVEGITLRDWLVERSVSAEEAAEICCKIAAGLTRWCTCKQITGLTGPISASSLFPAWESLPAPPSVSLSPWRPIRRRAAG